MQLSLTNTGNSDLTNVNLTSSAPTGWTVRFANETIDIIEAGATVETTMYTPPAKTPCPATMPPPHRPQQRRER